MFQVYVDVDSAGYLVPRGAGGAGGAGCAGGAALCARAALAPNVHARTALLTAHAPAHSSWPASTETLVSHHFVSVLNYVFFEIPVDRSFFRIKLIYNEVSRKSFKFRKN